MDNEDWTHLTNEVIVDLKAEMEKQFAEYFPEADQTIIKEALSQYLDDHPPVLDDIDLYNRGVVQR